MAVLWTLESVALWWEKWTAALYIGPLKSLWLIRFTPQNSQDSGGALLVIETTRHWYVCRFVANPLGYRKVQSCMLGYWQILFKLFVLLWNAVLWIFQILWKKPTNKVEWRRTINKHDQKNICTFSLWISSTMRDTNWLHITTGTCALWGGRGSERPAGRKHIQSV